MRLTTPQQNYLIGVVVRGGKQSRRELKQARGEETSRAREPGWGLYWNHFKVFAVQEREPTEIEGIRMCGSQLGALII